MGGLWIHGPRPPPPFKHQEAPLLRLPPEVRNIIYTYVAHNEDGFIFKDGRLGQYRPYRPVLMRVCHQIRQEYEGIYQSETPRAVSHFVVHLNNFIGGELEFDLDHVIPKPLPGVTRTFTFKVTIDNMLNHYAHDMRQFSSEERQWWMQDDEQVASSVEVRFDRKAFVVHLCQEWLLKFGLWGYSGKTIKEAFGKAFEEVEKEAKGRKRKGKKGEAEVKGRKRVKAD